MRITIVLVLLATGALAQTYQTYHATPECYDIPAGFQCSLNPRVVFLGKLSEPRDLLKSRITLGYSDGTGASYSILDPQYSVTKQGTSSRFGDAYEFKAKKSHLKLASGKLITLEASYVVAIQRSANDKGTYTPLGDGTVMVREE